MKAKNKNIRIDMRTVFVLYVFMICLFAILFVLKDGVAYNDNNLKVNANITNTLVTMETIELNLNDSIYLLNLDSNETKELKVTYRKGLNKIIIYLSDSKSIIDTIINVDTRYPGELYIELDKPSDKLGFLWPVDTSINRGFGFYKTLIGVRGNKRLKLAFASFLLM